MTDDDWQFLPLPHALAGPSSGFVQVFSNRWWSVCPKRGLRFYNQMKANGRRQHKSLGSPQCNADQRIMARFCKPGDDVIFIERVFVPVNLGDWRD